MKNYFIILFSILIMNQTYGVCKRTTTKKILVDDLDVYLSHKFEKISTFFSFEEVETPDGLKIRIEQDGCQEYVERFIFTLPFGLTSPGDGNLLLQKSIELLNQLKFRKDYKNSIKDVITTLTTESKKTDHYIPGDEIKVKRSQGKEIVHVKHSRHGANQRKITITRLIDITWK